MIASRWKKILPAVIAECQHGFVYGRRQFENVMKIRDACAMADMTADTKYYEQHPDSIPAGHQPDLLLRNGKRSTAVELHRPGPD